MSTPTYIPLLNSIVLGERGGQELHNVWADHTADEEFADCLRFVAIREGEHAKAFTKRLCELGFAVNNAGKGGFKNLDELLQCVSSSASDAEKADNLFCHLFGAPPESGDGFTLYRRGARQRSAPCHHPAQKTKFFSDNTIDPETGALLGQSG
jgi:hypothetical protein